MSKLESARREARRRLGRFSSRFSEARLHSRKHDRDLEIRLLSQSKALLCPVLPPGWLNERFGPHFSKACSSEESAAAQFQSLKDTPNSPSMLVITLTVAFPPVGSFSNPPSFGR